jgi:DNA-binding transcriptional ArsR family regulator
MLHIRRERPSSPVDMNIVECAALIAEKLGISQPTLSEHVKVLCHAGLLQSKRIKQWTFCRRDERRIREIRKSIASDL